MHASRYLLPPILIALLAACSGGEPAAPDAKAADTGLPAPPAAPAGSVTGMPTPSASTSDPGLAAVAPTPPAVEDATPASPDPAQDLAADTDAAMAVLRDYYAAINAGDFPRAHALWRQNPQTPAQFAEGFAQTAGVSVEMGAPGPIDAGAGQRYIEIPVRLEANQANGQVERYTGRYVLHRSVVEGGNPVWRIERATLAKQ